MRKVIKVREDAVRSEFPSFDGMMVFSVFNLKEDVGCPTSSVLQDMIPGKKNIILKHATAWKGFHSFSKFPETS